MRAGRWLASDSLKRRSWRGSAFRWFLSAVLMLMALSAPQRKYPVYRQQSSAQAAPASDWLHTLRWFGTKAIFVLAKCFCNACVAKGTVCSQVSVGKSTFCAAELLHEGEE